MSDGTRVHSQKPDPSRSEGTRVFERFPERDAKDRLGPYDISICWFIVDDDGEAFSLGPLPGPFRFYPDAEPEKALKLLTSSGSEPEEWVYCDDEQLLNWLHSRRTKLISAVLPKGTVVTGMRRQSPGLPPLALCCGQVWKLEEGEVTIEHVLETEGVLVKSSSNRSTYKVKTLRFKQGAKFISGPQTPEEEILWMAQREIENVPEGLDPRRWMAIVAAAREQIFLTYAAPIVAPQQFCEALALVRKLAPLFTRPI